MFKDKSIYSSLVSVFTGGYAITNIQDILSVIILILSILNILYNLGCKIYNRIKSKQFKEISDDIDEAKEDLTDLKEEEK